MLTAMIKGLGLQNKIVLWTFIGYYLIGLPLAFFLAFKAQKFFKLKNTPYLKHIHGFNGLYVGFIVSTAIMNFWYARVIYCFNWREHSQKMQNDLYMYRSTARRPN